jgi:hypothetical protein
LLGLALPQRTLAQTPAAAPSDSVRDRAAAAFAQGLFAFQSGNFELARSQYEAAYRLSPHPNTLYNLALSCERLLDYDAAIAAFAQFLDAPLPTEAEAERTQQTRRLLAERSLSRLRNLPARISISSLPNPVTASVLPLRDGQVVIPPLDAGGIGQRPGHDSCLTPCIFTLPASSYRLTLARDGYFAESEDFTAHVGQALLISRQLRPQPRRVQIDAVPPGRLYLDDRLLGETPFVGEISLGPHRLRLERNFYLTQRRPLDLGPGAAPLRYRVVLERSGRADMILGGALAGAGLGLMVLRLFLGEEIETLPRQEIYKPLAAATLPAVLGAGVAAFAGWEMPVSEAQLLLGTAGWGTLTGFGLGLGAQPQGPLPHVLAIGGGLIGGTLGTAAYRFIRPSSGAAALFNSAALWSSVLGALGWAYLISDRPTTAFYGHPSTGRSGEGGWTMFGSTLGGVALGIGLSALPLARELSREEVALVDLGGALGGLTVGALGLGIGYLRTGSWNQTAHLAVPSAIAGIAAGLLSASLLVHFHRQRLRDGRPAVAQTPIRSGPPQLRIDRDLRGGVAVGIGVVDGSF